MPETIFMPDPSSPYAPPTYRYNDANISGPGSPDGAVPAWPGAVYTDTDTGDLYQKITGEGTTDGWNLHSGGGGSGGTSSGSGSPEGAVTGVPGNTYWDATNNVFYVKDTGVGTDTGWRELIA